MPTPDEASVQLSHITRQSASEASQLPGCTTLFCAQVRQASQDKDVGSAILSKTGAVTPTAHLYKAQGG